MTKDNILIRKAERQDVPLLFHYSGYRCLKHFYLNEVCVNLRHLFPQVVSYNRFVELENRLRLRLCRRRKRSYRSPSLSRRYFWENALASVLLTPRLCVCAETNASISIRLSRALLPEASARWDGFSGSSYT